MKQNAGFSEFITQPPSAARCMSVQAAPFVPGSEMQEVSSAEDQAVKKRKAREYALKILAGGGGPVPSTSSAADQAAGAASNAEATWWRTGNTDAKGPLGEHLDEDAHDNRGRDDSEEGEEGEEGEEELRIDPADGLLYCKSDFLLEYGGTAEWDAAVAAAPHPLNPSELPKWNRVSEAGCGVSEYEPEPEPEPLASHLYMSGSDSEDPEPVAVERVESANAASMALLIDMGFARDLARRALAIHPDSIEAAAAWMLQGGADSADAPVHKQTERERGASTPGASTRSEERRIDQADGIAYTQAEFADEYGGLDEWNEAVPSKPISPARAFSVSYTYMCNYLKVLIVRQLTLTLMLTLTLILHVECVSNYLRM